VGRLQSKKDSRHKGVREEKESTTLCRTDLETCMSETDFEVLQARPQAQMSTKRAEICGDVLFDQVGEGA